jgi:hypothetical protein
MLTCVGRGSNAQQVRDEILNIMHRNKVGGGVGWGGRKGGVIIIIIIIMRTCKKCIAISMIIWGHACARG